MAANPNPTTDPCEDSPAPRADRPRKPRKFLARLVGVVVLLMVLGHVSNLLSLRASEVEVLEKYCTYYAKDQRLRYWREDPRDTMFNYTLLSVHEPAAGVEYVDRQEDAGPYVFVEPAETACPFITTVRVDHYEGNLATGGGRVFVFTLFGWAQAFWYDREWVS